MRTKSFSRDSSRLLDKILCWWRIRAIKQYMKPGSTVCDLGCGTKGYFLRKIEPLIKSGQGFDVQVSNNQDGSKTSLQEIDLDKALLPVTSSSVETVTSLAVIEHLNNELHHIKEAFRILRPGGLFVVTTPHPRSDIVLRFLAGLNLIGADEIKDHKKYFTAEKLSNLLKQNGFKKVKCHKFQFGFNQAIVGEK
jgi:2-polyprenyl-3-methyl-5-hydroxy-6-metoxy-1,4-benzoquinol methylase